MKKESFNTTIMVNQSPMDMFDAVNNVNGWWSKAAKGDSIVLHDLWRIYFETIS